MGLITPAVIKGLAGAASLTVALTGVGVGGTYLYSREKVSYSKKDLEAFNSNGNWTLATSPTTISGSNQNTNVEISIQLTNSTWSCKIKGTIKTVGSGESLDISTQSNDFGTRIGITSGSKRNLTKESNFQNFFENCIRHRTTNDENPITIDLGDLKVNQNKYKFKDQDLKDIYSGVFFSQKLKETRLNLTCTDASCTITTNKKLEGFTSANGKTITITKSEVSGEKDFENGIKYTIAGTKGQDGEYTIKSNWLGKPVLSWVKNTTPST